MARLKMFIVYEHKAGIGILFQALAAHTENKFAQTQFLALRCARYTPAPLVEDATTCTHVNL